MKDTKTILLALLSIGLVATWVYHIYDKTRYAVVKKEVVAKDPSVILSHVRDSLQTVYSTTVDKLGEQLDSVKNTAGVLQGELSTRISEINILRSEIAGLLVKNNIRKEDLDVAGKKTTEFQQLVSGLPKKNSTIAEEKKQTVTQPVDPGNAVVEKNPDQVNPSNTESVLFTASELKLTPVKVSNDREEETNNAEDAGKLVVSFAVKSNAVDLGNAEVFAVITQPDGKVLQTDVWESSYINTHDYGKKTYTRKMKFEYQKGETKRLQLTLRPEDYERGNYRLQVFHNGYLIGEAVKTLN